MNFEIIFSIFTFLEFLFLAWLASSINNEILARYKQNKQTREIFERGEEIRKSYRDVA